MRHSIITDIVRRAIRMIGQRITVLFSRAHLKWEKCKFVRRLHQMPARNGSHIASGDVRRKRDTNCQAHQQSLSQ